MQHHPSFQLAFDIPDIAGDPIAYFQVPPGRKLRILPGAFLVKSRAASAGADRLNIYVDTALGVCVNVVYTEANLTMLLYTQWGIALPNQTLLEIPAGSYLKLKTTRVANCACRVVFNCCWIAP